MQCEFCNAGSDVRGIWKKGRPRCGICWEVNKDCGRGTGVYYDNVAQRYVSGEQLCAESPKRALVLDLHNVVDLLSTQEFVQYVQPLTAKFDLITLLSYVGINTPTRVAAQTHMQQLCAAVPNVRAFLCFKRGDTIRPGNKGAFVQQMGAQQTWFLDDGEDHVQAVQTTGAHCTLVPRGPDGHRVVVKTLVRLHDI